ncbi:MAG: hypothetical protein WC360_09430 [Opitutales bacterium]
MIENLLVLQDRDVRRDDIVRRLEDMPLQIAAVEREILGVEEALRRARDEHKALEVRRRELEHSTMQAEEQRNRFRTQQLQVKKNEEYAALEKQIDGAGELIDRLETETIEVMIKLDETVEELALRQKTADTEIARLRGNIATLQRVLGSIQGDLADAETQLVEARAAIPESAMATYIYVKGRVKRHPYVVPVEDQHCMGCHLKVSNDVIQQARFHGTLTRCDSCSRIVYM